MSRELTRGPEWVRSLFKKHGDATFLLTRKRTQSYQSFYTLASDLAAHLPPKDQEGRQIVTIMCKRPERFVLAYFAALLAGHVPMPIAHLLKGRELQALLTGSHVVISDCLSQADLQAVTWRVSVDEELAVYGLAGAEAPLVADDRVAVLLPTSGTFGKVKRVMLSFDNLQANVSSLVQALQVTAKDVTLVALPLHYSFAHTTQMWLHFLLGAPLLLTDGVFLPKLFFQLCEEFCAVSTGIVAQNLNLLLTSTAVAQKYDLQSLRTMIVAGGKTPSLLIEGAQDLFPRVQVLQGYGLTEAAPRVSIERFDEQPRKQNGLRSSGRPLPGVEVVVRDADDGRLLPPNVEGILAVRGPNVMLGYLDDAVATKEALQNGWLITGDVGSVDEDGYLYVRGRAKNLFVHKGYKIFPEDIEATVLQDERIAACRVYLEEQTLTLLVQSSSVTDQEIRSRLQQELPYWKMPERILFGKVDLTSNGKTKRVESEK